jgi:hypothetical protein
MAMMAFPFLGGRKERVDQKADGFGRESEAEKIPGFLPDSLHRWDESISFDHLNGLLPDLLPRFCGPCLALFCF